MKRDGSMGSDLEIIIIDEPKRCLSTGATAAEDSRQNARIQDILSNAPYTNGLIL